MALCPSDSSSYSRPDLCKVSNIDIDLNINFEKHILQGFVELTLEKIKADTTSLLLDTRDLVIKEVKDATCGSNLDFKHSQPHLDFGAKLEVFLKECTKKVVIHYETSPVCSALQWMKPEQTAGGKHPYMFSQCQAIHCRSLLPCQDSPGVKMPYSAKLTHPSTLTSLMSAISDGTPTSKDGLTTSCFEQTIPVPSYLIAMVCGALKSKDISPRIRVWCEQEQLAESYYEFGETEKWLQSAEKYCGPYVWKRYDLLVLPPSFPYGGMENPCISFMTPTLLAGDRSLISVLAHEISHSWTGNLVTNQRPDDFWLNEGHTVFIERKIIGMMYGEPARQFEAIGGYSELKNQVNNVFDPKHPFTHLVPDLTGINPDDSFSTVPYEKGCALLMYLEEKLGGPDAFDPFIKSYIDNFKYKSITTDIWKEYVYKFFAEKKDILDSVDWNTWLYKPGMPPAKADYDDSLAIACESLATKWYEAGDDLSSLTAFDIDCLSPFQVKEFLSILSEKGSLNIEKLVRLESLHKFNAIKNCEIKLQWLHLCLKNHFKESIDFAIEFVNAQGRMKFVRPIYRDLFKWEESKQRAIDNYKKQVPFMHNLTASMLGKDMGLE